MDLLKTIREYSDLENNWDGYGAPYPVARVLNAASSIARALPPGSWTVRPTSVGGVLFEEERGLTIEVRP